MLIAKEIAIASGAGLEVLLNAIYSDWKLSSF